MTEWRVIMAGDKPTGILRETTDGGVEMMAIIRDLTGAWSRWHTILRQGSAALLAATLCDLIPIIPSVAASPFGSFSVVWSVRENVHPHKCDMLFFRENVVVPHATYENVVPSQTQKPSNVPPQIRPQDEVIIKNLPLPINLLSGCWKSRAPQEFPSNFCDATRHSASVDHIERERGLTVSKFKWAVAKEDISALKGVDISFAASDSKPSDDDKAVSKISDKQISELRFFAEPRWHKVVEIGGAGVLMMISGVFLLHYENIIHFIGALFVISGISLALYGPSIWFLWGAQ